MKRISWIVGWLTLLYGLLCGALYLGQRALIYPAPRRGIEPQLPGAKLERIGSEPHTVYALHAPAPDNARTLVHFHGNGEELADVVPLLAAFQRAGLGVYAIEYPGYGLAREGVPSEQALYDSAETALVFLETRLGVARASMILHGQSLGTAVAVEMACRGYGAGLVLLAPFTSLPELAARIIPFVPARWLVRDRYDSRSKAERLALPVLVIHGQRDEVVPFDMGRSLGDSIPGSRFVAVQEGGHNDLFSFAGSRVFSEIVRFARGAGIE